MKKSIKKTTAVKKAAKTKKPTTKKPVKRAETKKTIKSSEKREVPIGRTLKTKDKYLSYEPKYVQKLKEHRWVAVIDKNTNEELAIVRLTDEKQPNTTHLRTYHKGNNKDTYFKHFVETEDKEGNAIKVDGKKFIENFSRYDLNNREVEYIKDVVIYRTKQSSENKKKISNLHNKKKKK